MSDSLLVKVLCLKLLLQFTCHVDETFYSWYLCSIVVHGKGVPWFNCDALFSKLLYILIEKVCPKLLPKLSHLTDLWFALFPVTKREYDFYLS